MTDSVHDSDRADRWFGRSLVAVAAFHVLHWVALPLVVSYDGFLYIDHADTIFSPRFPEDYDFFRTPLFPIFIKATFALFGKSAMAFLALNVGMSFCASALLASAVRRFASSGAAIAVLWISALHPLTITYAHCALSETGTFLALATLVWVVANTEERPTVRSIVAPILALSAGYYFRPTIVYLSLVVGPVLLLTWWRGALGATTPRRLALGGALLVIIVPHVAALPWNRIPGASARVDGQYANFMIKQMVLPPGDPALGEYADDYTRALRASTRDGRLCASGMVSGREYPIFGYTTQTYPGGGRTLFLQAIKHHPRRYAEAAARTFAVAIGRPSCESENRVFRRLASEDVTGTRLLPGPASLDAPTRAAFAETRSATWMSALVTALVGPFAFLTTSAWALLVPALLIGAWRRNRGLVLIAALPIGYAAMHVIVLMSIDRYFVPVYPLVLAASVLAVYETVTALRGYRHAKSDAPRVAPDVHV